MKGAFDEEQDDTKKQITDLQYDLLELRDAHAKLRTTNEKLRRDKEKFERERDEYRYMVSMALPVMEFQDQGYKIRKVFA
jgi:mitofilin